MLFHINRIERTYRFPSAPSGLWVAFVVMHTSRNRMKTFLEHTHILPDKSETDIHTLRWPVRFVTQCSRTWRQCYSCTMSNGRHCHSEAAIQDSLCSCEQYLEVLPPLSLPMSNYRSCSSSVVCIKLNIFNLCLQPLGLWIKTKVAQVLLHRKLWSVKHTLYAVACRAKCKWLVCLNIKLPTKAKALIEGLLVGNLAHLNELQTNYEAPYVIWIIRAVVLRINCISLWPQLHDFCRTKQTKWTRCKVWQYLGFEM